MSTFAYSGYDARGRLCRGWVEASSPKHARVMLREQGMVAESVRAADARSARMSAADRERLYREIGTLLQAGLPLERVLGVLMESGEPAPALSAAALREAIRDGASMVQAMIRVGGTLPESERAALMAAERSGDLARICLRVADGLENAHALRSRIRGALLYPAFVLGLGMIVAMLTGFFLAPRALAMLNAMRGDPPPGVVAAVALARGVSWALLAMPFVLVPAGLWIRRWLREKTAWRRRVEKVFFQLPFLHAVLAPLWSSRFAWTLAVLNRAGAPLVEAFALAGQASGSRWITEDAAVQADALRHGLQLSRAIDALPPIRSALGEWIRIGETGGCLSDMLEQAAQRSQAVYERRVTRAMALAEPILILAIGLFVLGVALSVLLPFLSVARDMV